MEKEKISSGVHKDEEKLLAHILKALKSVHYGYVHITVQDDKIVQVEKAEKVRFDKASISWYT